MPPTIPAGGPPVAVADIDEAADMAQSMVHFAHADGATNLRALANAWNAGFLPLFTPTQGVVRNWNIILFRRAGLIADGVAASTLQDADEFGNLLWRQLNAVRQAQIDGNITAAQRNDVVALYNATWV